MDYRRIDWNRIWQESRARKSWRGKSDRDWDKRAKAFAARNLHSSYVDHFLAFLHPDPLWTVLDVGCGPGTIALPLAQRVQAVTAVDFSPRMLESLEAEARAQGIENIRAIHASWEDDWVGKEIPPHDLTIASRSLSVDDLQGALAKLNRWARKRVVISDRVGSGPFDPDLFAAVGRNFEPGPDYIVTVNILYGMGIRARVDFLTMPDYRVYASRQEAVDSCLWMLDGMTPREEEGFARYLDERLAQQEDGSWRLSRRRPPSWALIWWDKEEAAPG